MTLYRIRNEYTTVPEIEEVNCTKVGIKFATLPGNRRDVLRSYESPSRNLYASKKEAQEQWVIVLRRRVDETRELLEIQMAQVTAALRAFDGPSTVAK